MGKLAAQGTGPLTIDGFKLTRVGLSPVGKPDLDTWKKAGGSLQQMDGAIHWWIGDWLNYGHEHYEHGQYEEALEVLPFTYSTITHDKWVAQQIESCRRRQNLSWSHHATVAPLELEQQEELLAEAEKEGWTRAELRRRIKEPWGDDDNGDTADAEYSKTESFAMAAADVAISQLDRVKPANPARSKAFAKVLRWIKSQGRDSDEC